MLVQLSPWSFTRMHDSKNNTSSSKKNAMMTAMVASTTSFFPQHYKHKNSSSRSLRKRRRTDIPSMSSLKQFGIVFTCPHNISFWKETDVNHQKLIPKDNNKNTNENIKSENGHGIEMEWTISSRPGKDNAFLSHSSSSSKSSGVDSLAIQVPSVYDPSNNRLYTVTNRNTSIQIYQKSMKKKLKTNGNHESDEQIIKNITICERSISSSSAIQSLNLYNQTDYQNDDKGGNNIFFEIENFKDFDKSSSNIVIGCTNDLKIILIQNCGEAHSIIDRSEELLKKIKENNETDSGGELNMSTCHHLWTGVTHSRPHSSLHSHARGIIYTISSIWMDKVSGKVILRSVDIRVSEKDHQTDENTTGIVIVKDSFEIMNFENIVQSNLEKKKNHLESIKACSFSQKEFAFIFQSSTNEENNSKEWLCCYCKMEYDEEIFRYSLKPNHTFRLPLNGISAMYTCAITSEIMAIYTIPASDISPKIILCDVTRDGLVLKSIPSNDLPSMNNVLGIASNQRLNQLILFNRDSLAISSLQLWDENNESHNLSLSKKVKKINLANLLASAISVQPNTFETNDPSITHKQKTKWEESYNMKHYNLQDMVKVDSQSNKTLLTHESSSTDREIQTKVSTSLKKMQQSEDPISYLLAYQDALTNLLPARKGANRNNTENSDSTLAYSIKNKLQPRQLFKFFYSKRFASLSQHIPSIFIKKACKMSLQILLSSSNYPSNKKYDPILHVLLHLFTIHPLEVLRHVWNEVDSTVERIPLVILNKILSLSSLQSKYSECGGGIVTESFKVDAWRYVVLKVRLEEVIHFYSFVMEYDFNNSMYDYFHKSNKNLLASDEILKEWIKDCIELRANITDDENQRHQRKLRRSVHKLISKAAHDFSVKIIMDSKTCNDALLRAAFYHHEILDENEVDTEIWMLASLLKVHGPIPVQNLNAFFSRQKIENLTQWINAVLDVHGSILIPKNREKNLHSSLTLLHSLVRHELDISQDIVDLQACLHLVNETISKYRISSRNVDNHSSALDGTSIIPSYGIEQLRF